MGGRRSLQCLRTRQRHGLLRVSAFLSAFTRRDWGRKELVISNTRLSDRCPTVLPEIPIVITQRRQLHAVGFLIDHFAFTRPAIHKRSRRIRVQLRNDGKWRGDIDTNVTHVYHCEPDNVIIRDVLAVHKKSVIGDSGNRNHDKSCSLDIAILSLLRGETVPLSLRLNTYILEKNARARHRFYSSRAHNRETFTQLLSIIRHQMLIHRSII